MALEGSLRDFDLFSLFNMIKTQGKSGTLVLSRAQEFVKIFFDTGEIVGCDSNQVRMEDRVGAMLVRLGRLSGDELLAMIHRQKQTLKRMGTLLVESGRVSPQDLQDALFNQAMSIIYRTFRWVEGDYRFDSILPPELDRENFPPIPVDTVLMEAARIMDEWPEVQRRLPDNALPLRKTEYGESLHLDIDKDLSTVLEGGSMNVQGSGLSHEQETVLTYFSTPCSVQGVLQISRYDELDTCKLIADLLERGILEVSPESVEERQPFVWAMPQAALKEPAEPRGPSLLFWPAVALFLGFPLAFYVPRGPASFNEGLASFQPASVRQVLDPDTRVRQAWAFRMASPSDGGRAIAKVLGCLLEDKSAVPDLTRFPNPMTPTPPEKSVAIPAEQ
ncbi:MAG TPA: DUF4388 domain-containing protein [Holophaga sp.]|nr:DUF4388 domain-containing protein [Holophaga sp.]